MCSSDLSRRPAVPRANPPGLLSGPARAGALALAGGAHGPGPPAPATCTRRGKATGTSSRRASTSASGAVTVPATPSRRTGRQLSLSCTAALKTVPPLGASGSGHCGRPGNLNLKGPSRPGFAGLTSARPRAAPGSAR